MPPSPPPPSGPPVCCRCDRKGVRNSVPAEYLTDHPPDDEWRHCCTRGWYCPDHEPKHACDDTDCGLCNPRDHSKPEPRPPKPAPEPAPEPAQSPDKAVSRSRSALSPDKGRSVKLASPAVSRSGSASQPHTRVANALDEAFSMLLESQNNIPRDMEERISYLEGQVSELLNVIMGQSKEEQHRKKQQAQALGQRVVLRMKMGHYLLIWDTLLANMQQNKRKKRMGQQAIKKVQNRLSSSAFASWLGSVKATKARKVAAEGEEHRASISENFRRLEELEEQMATDKSQRDSDINQLNSALQQMEGMVVSGRDQVRQEQIKWSLKQIVNRMKNSNLSRVWYPWKQQARASKELKERHRKALNMMMSSKRVIAWPFGEWVRTTRSALRSQQEASVRSNWESLSELQQKVEEQGRHVEELVSDKTAQIEMLTKYTALTLTKLPAVRSKSAPASDFD
jgi:hypothetical protein